MGNFEVVHERIIGITFPDQEAERRRRISAGSNKERDEQRSERKSRSLHQSSIQKKAASIRKQEFNLKGGRSVDPEQPGFSSSGIAPAMWRGALEIETVAGLHTVVFIRVQPDFEFAAKDMQKFLAFVGIGFAAAAARLHAKQMWLHGGVAPGQKLHANAFGGFENFAFGGLDQLGIVLCRLQEGNNIGGIETRDAAQSGDGTAHLSAFEGA